jgi:hypothetical protein
LATRSPACRYLEEPKIAILHQENSSETPTKVCDFTSETLVKFLWPGCILGDGSHGRAILLEYPANGEAVMHALSWLKDSVEKGAYQHLSVYGWRTTVLHPRIKQAAEVMEIEKLVEVVRVAEASGIPDAAETVQH